MLLYHKFFCVKIDSSFMITSVTICYFAYHVYAFIKLELRMFYMLILGKKNNVLIHIRSLKLTLMAFAFSWSGCCFISHSICYYHKFSCSFSCLFIDNLSYKISSVTAEDLIHLVPLFYNPGLTQYIKTQ